MKSFLARGNYIKLKVKWMSEECGCKATNLEFDGLCPIYKRILIVVILINATMFFVEIFAGHMASSQALKADALDFLGDTVTYALSFAVIGQSLILRSKMAFVKGLSLAAFGVYILGSTFYRFFFMEVPVAEVMGWVGFAALLVNLASVVLLYKYANGDANIRSVWLCSRNDAVGNIGVMVAASLVFYTGSALPDLIIAILMASLFFSSAISIIKQACAELRSQKVGNQKV